MEFAAAAPECLLAVLLLHVLHLCCPLVTVEVQVHTGCQELRQDGCGGGLVFMRYMLRVDEQLCEHWGKGVCVPEFVSLL